MRRQENRKRPFRCKDRERVEVDAVDAGKQRLGCGAAVRLAPAADRFEQEGARSARRIGQRIGWLPFNQIHPMFSQPVRGVELTKCMPHFPRNKPLVSNLTLLEPYRPIFIGAALIALFFARRRIWRPVTACAPGEVCALPQINRSYKVLFGIVVALVIIALGFPLLAPWFY